MLEGRRCGWSCVRGEVWGGAVLEGVGWSCVRGEEVWGGAVLEGRRCGVELC